MEILLVALLVVVVLLLYVASVANANRNKRPTVLICGATGVGKSTLINVLLGRPASEVGIGEPVTQNTTLVDAPDSAFAFYDSRGLEVEEASHTYLLLLSDLFRLRFEPAVRRQIDFVVMCIAEPSARYDDAHLEIANLCEDLRVPLGIVLTKADGNAKFRGEIAAAFPTARFIQPVRALPLVTPMVTVPAEGLDEFRTLLQNHAVFDLRDARRRARHAPKAQRMAQTARDLVGDSSDAAWASLAGSAYALLMGKEAGDWAQWLNGARSDIKRRLVPGFFRRVFNTKFDDPRIDGEIARRIFPSILRHFSVELDTFAPAEVEQALDATWTQLQERRPFRSRF